MEPMQPLLLTLLLLLLLLTAPLAPVCDATEMPRFDFEDSKKIVLGLTDTWQVGGPHQFALLSDGAGSETKNIRVAVTGGQCTNKEAELQYKCPGSTVFQNILLPTIPNSPSESECSKMKFSIKRSATDNIFEFHLPKSVGADYSRTFKDRLELKVRVMCSEATLTSNSLFVYSLAPLKTFQAELKTDPVIGKYRQSYLTKDGIDFLQHMGKPNDTTGNIKSFQFIEPSIMKVINGAPIFIKSNINVGVRLQISRSRCGVEEQYFTVVNKKSKTEAMFLDPSNGKLHYSVYGLSRDAVAFIKPILTTANGLRFCSASSFISDDVLIRILNDIGDYKSTQVNYKQLGKPNSECYAPNKTQQDIVIFSGGSETQLMCPIFCSPEKQEIHFEKDGVKLKQNTGARSWITVDGGLQMHNGKRRIKFPKMATKSNAGVYSCHSGTSSFTFNVSILSMPRIENDPALPHTIFAVEGEGLTYSCTTAFINLKQVTMTSEFHTNHQSGGGGKWSKLSLQQFNSLLELKGDAQVTATVADEGSEKKSLTVNVSSVPSPVHLTNSNFTHRFVCHVSVGAEDAQKIDLPSYSVQTGANVFFVSRPTVGSFDFGDTGNCSATSCTFAAALLPELTDYFRDNGVRVSAHFLFDGHLLSDIDVLQEASEEQFDDVTNRLTWIVRPVSDPAVMALLRKRHSLRPVFELRYAADTGSLRMHKDKYGVAVHASDCRNDPLCFYSTEFDAVKQLSGLQFVVQFNDAAIAAASINFGLIAGIAVAVVMVKELNRLGA